MSRREGHDPRVGAWWDSVLAGDTDQPHPVHGRDVSVRLRDGRLVLSGELRQAEDRDRLLRQARARIGRGIQGVEHSHLRLVDKGERPGILDQTLIASYPDLATARRASAFVLEHSRVKPRMQAVIGGSTKNVVELLPQGYVEDVRRRLADGEAVVVMRVDETDAFLFRELMDADTSSTWMVAAPPELRPGAAP